MRRWFLLIAVFLQLLQVLSLVTIEPTIDSSFGHGIWQIMQVELPGPERRFTEEQFNGARWSGQVSKRGGQRRLHLLSQFSSAGARQVVGAQVRQDEAASLNVVTKS
ncbi:hypothetical protein MTO96_040328 [Rhipicephalus appendiculatus]